MWTSLLMMIFGLWLIAQALIGDLSGRLLSWGKGL